jgi:outer membrane protein TolC
MRIGAAGVAVLCVAVAARVAAASPATPSLGDFLAAARDASLEVREQRATVDERDAAERVEGANLRPRLSASADYLRNQYDVDVTIPRGPEPPLTATIQPTNQVDATVELDVPLLDLATRRRRAATAYDAAAARSTLAASATEVERSVVRAYYQWVGGVAELASARSARAAAVDNVTVLESRHQAGLTNDLDLARARSQVARSDETIADAQLTIASARRILRTYTGLDARGDAPQLSTDTSEEAPLDRWLAAAGAAPEVASAVASERSAEESAAADRLGYLPTLTALGRERLTNAAGFGNEANWAVGVTATWQLDFGKPARTAQSAAAEHTAQISRDRAARDAGDRIIDAWDTVEQLRAHTAAAVAQFDADKVAVDVAHSKFSGGQATALDVVLAERDALDSESTMLHARADLAAARALLRLAAGSAP